MRSRFTRRLVFAVLWLALLDPFVPRLMQRVERQRYESGGVFRFENSDLFALGPLVSYLREHPHGERRRLVFFGNSIVFGYGLAAADAIPAQFEKLQPDTRVFNAAFNGAEEGSSLLIAKTIVAAVDSLFVLVGPGDKAHELLPALIPVAESDLRAFGLRAPDRVERRLEALAGAWRLYASRYRLQAALFGTSTRQYVYFHKRELVRRMLALGASPAFATPAPWLPGDDAVALRAPRATVAPDAEGGRRLRQRHEIPCELAELARSHGKRAVLLQFEGINCALGDAEVADFNAAFAPFAEVVVLVVPAALRFDAMHLTPAGAQAVAVALARHETERGVDPR